LEGFGNGSLVLFEREEGTVKSFSKDERMKRKSEILVL